MKPSLVSSTRLSESVKLRCTLGSGSFEGGRGPAPSACGSRPCVSPRPRVRLRLSPPRRLRPPPQAPVWPRGFWPSASVCRRSSLAFRRRDGLRRGLCPLPRRLLPQHQATYPLQREPPSPAPSSGHSSSPFVWMRSPSPSALRPLPPPPPPPPLF